ncbi:MAG: hypothetical protein ACRERC_07120 [Candidatus Binatia bacterium]
MNIAAQIRARLAVAALAALVLCLPALADQPDPGAETSGAAGRSVSGLGGPPITLSGGAPSIDILLDEFLAAVERKDLAALERLRLTKEEYTRIIVPGQVKKGEPPLQTFEKANEVFWGMLNTRSRYTIESLVNEHGGRHYVRRQLQLTEPVREFAWYTAYGGVDLTVWDEKGQDYELVTGWIAKVEGAHKFIAFSRAD